MRYSFRSRPAELPAVVNPRSRANVPAVKGAQRSSRALRRRGTGVREVHDFEAGIDDTGRTRAKDMTMWWQQRGSLEKVDFKLDELTLERPNGVPTWASISR